jgi:hypothetical protein
MILYATLRTITDKSRALSVVQTINGRDGWLILFRLSGRELAKKMRGAYVDTEPNRKATLRGGWTGSNLGTTF